MKKTAKRKSAIPTAKQIQQRVWWQREGQIESARIALLRITSELSAHSAAVNILCTQLKQLNDVKARSQGLDV